MIPIPSPTGFPVTPPSPERVPVQEDAPSWYFRGFPLRLELVPGISGAEATGGQEKYRGNQPGQECRPGRLNLRNACHT